MHIFSAPKEIKLTVSFSDYMELRDFIGRTVGMFDDQYVVTCLEGSTSTDNFNDHQVVLTQAKKSERVDAPYELAFPRREYT